MHPDPDTAIGGSAKRFPETRRTLIDCLRSSSDEERRRGCDLLFSTYWKPLYKYARIKWRRSNEEAKDLVQSFFAASLEKDFFSSFDPQQARFQTFTRLLFDRFITNADKAGSRLKRGGDLHEVDFADAEREIGSLGDQLSADEFLHREWVRNFFTTTIEELRTELISRGKPHVFEAFAAYDLAEEPRPKYREIAARMDLTETTVTNLLAAARRRFREILLDRLRAVTATEEEFRREARELLGWSE